MEVQLQDLLIHKEIDIVTLPNVTVHNIDKSAPGIDITNLFVLLYQKT